MKQNIHFKTLLCTRNAMPVVILILLSCLLFCSNVFAADKTVKFNGDTTAEKKVDYLERIYFSGEDKEGLNTNILIAIQDIQTKTATNVLIKQITFLMEIQEKASAAKDACEILDLLAVGIYNIDAAEAVKEGVRPATSKAKAKSVDALASLGKLNSTANNLSGNASNLAWSSYLLSGGKYGSFASGAGKVATGAAKVGNTINAIGQAGETGKQLLDVGKSLGIKINKKDKACNDVAKKDIVIGEHGVTGAVNPGENKNTTTADNTIKSEAGEIQTTVINIPGIDYNSLKTLSDSLSIQPWVKSAEKKFNTTLSSITLIYISGKGDRLLDWIMEKFSARFNLVAADKTQIDLKMIK